AWARDDTSSAGRSGSDAALGRPEDGQAALERVAMVEVLPQLRRPREALEIPGEVPPRAVDAEGLAPLLDVGDEVLAAERDALGGGRGRHVFAAIEPRGHLAEHPRVLDGAAPDHDPRAA